MSIIPLFCEIDDFCLDKEPEMNRHLLSDGKRKRLRKSTLHRSFVMTIIVTKIRRNMKNKLMPLFDKLLWRKRAIISTIHDPLKNISQMNIPVTEVARAFWSMSSRLWSRIPINKRNRRWICVSKNSVTYPLLLFSWYRRDFPFSASALASAWRWIIWLGCRYYSLTPYVIGFHVKLGF